MPALGGVLFWILLLAWVFLIRPKSQVHRVLVAEASCGRKIILAVFMTGILILEVFLMGLSPIWNGEISGHRNQYELITESFLDGRLDFDYEVDPGLLEMENPYDMKQREELGVKAHFDHAFYHGKYYMYFGVVPVLIAFLPYRVITGCALLTWHATFFFTAVFLAGLAVYMYRLIHRHFSRMSWGAFVSLLVAFSLASTLYIVKFPSLYQTPVACGLMLEIWSFFCFSRAFSPERTEGFSFPLAALGSLLGALTFGCRPPLALANLMYVPLLARFMKGRKITGKMIFRLTLSLIPYALVAIGLMWYNAARFDNPFEFGQSYQITIVDQTVYRSVFTLENLVRAPAGIFNSLFVVAPIDMLFPWLRTGGGSLSACPLLLLAFSFLLPRPSGSLKKEGLLCFSIMLIVSTAVIAASQIIWSPKLLDRYQSDYIWLLGIGGMLGAGAWFERVHDKVKLSSLLCFASLACVIIVLLLFLVPSDGSYTDYDKEAILRIWNMITLKNIR